MMSGNANGLIPGPIRVAGSGEQRPSSSPSWMTDAYSGHPTQPTLNRSLRQINPNPYNYMLHADYSQQMNYRFDDMPYPTPTLHNDEMQMSLQQLVGGGSPTPGSPHGHHAADRHAQARQAVYTRGVADLSHCVRLSASPHHAHIPHPQMHHRQQFTNAYDWDLNSAAAPFLGAPPIHPPATDNPAFYNWQQPVQHLAHDITRQHAQERAALQMNLLRQQQERQEQVPKVSDHDGIQRTWQEAGRTTERRLVNRQMEQAHKQATHPPLHEAQLTRSRLPQLKLHDTSEFPTQSAALGGFLGGGLRVAPSMQMPCGVQCTAGLASDAVTPVARGSPRIPAGSPEKVLKAVRAKVTVAASVGTPSLPHNIASTTVHTHSWNGDDATAPQYTPLALVINNALTKLDVVQKQLKLIDPTVLCKVRKMVSLIEQGGYIGNSARKTVCSHAMIKSIASLVTQEGALSKELRAARAESTYDLSRGPTPSPTKRGQHKTGHLAPQSNGVSKPGRKPKITIVKSHPTPPSTAHPASILPLQSLAPTQHGIPTPNPPLSPPVNVPRIPEKRASAGPPQKRAKPKEISPLERAQALVSGQCARSQQIRFSKSRLALPSAAVRADDRFLIHSPDPPLGLTVKTGKEGPSTQGPVHFVHQAQGGMIACRSPRTGDVVQAPRADAKDDKESVDDDEEVEDIFTLAKKHGIAVERAAVASGGEVVGVTDKFRRNRAHWADICTSIDGSALKRPASAANGDSGATRCRRGRKKDGATDTGKPASLTTVLQDASENAKRLFVVRPSAVAGLGVYTTQDIPAKTVLMEYKGVTVRRVHIEEIERRYEAAGKDFYVFSIDQSDQVIDATQEGGTARFVNHSCGPNSEVKTITADGQKRVILKSVKPLLAGEELSYDYRLSHDPDKAIKCRCGFKRCRMWL